MKKTESKAFKAKTGQFRSYSVQALKITELSDEQINAILSAEIAEDK